jgi:hypothetical protein
MHCNGKCYLTKKLKQEEEKEKKPEQQTQKKQYDECIFSELLVLNPTVKQVQIIYPEPIPAVPTTFTTVIYQPPKV